MLSGTARSVEPSECVSNTKPRFPTQHALGSMMMMLMCIITEHNIRHQLSNVYLSIWRTQTSQLLLGMIMPIVVIFWLQVAASRASWSAQGDASVSELSRRWLIVRFVRPGQQRARSCSGDCVCQHIWRLVGFRGGWEMRAETNWANKRNANPVTSR